ncbi:hypothetical protein HYT02_04690 [Candidatus Gottesmanbacteria bacterium]|nr:hypothetical protein [Candidatus Gottesmanbacteria bacterium]
MDEGQIKPVDYSPSKKPVYIITFLLILLLVEIAVIITLLVGRNRQPEVKIQPTPIPTVTTIPQDNTSTSSSIVYSRDNNIWSVRPDGTQLRQITRDGDGTTITYPSYMFIDKDILVFIKCIISQSSCSVIERNLITDTETPGIDIPTLITNYSQSTDNDPVFAYITSASSGSSNLVMKIGDNTETIIEFAPGLGRGGSFSDEQSLKFSANNQYLLVVNTGTQPNIDDDKTSIWIVDKKGNIVDTIGGDFASNAVWESNNRILYLQSGNLYRRVVGSESTLIGPLDGYNISMSSDGKTFLYWNTSDDGTTIVNTYTLADNKTQEVTGNISSPKWVDLNSFAGFSTIKSEESMFGFELDGLVNYSIANSKITTLDSNSSIWNVVVSP